ncbi:Pvc16 family protein [Streptomyces yaizuensis]|uniref:DUF4255 domain-containing protein n=1 Tax=Streptomyces yaizuensis TaxID=2989713 RepID=A0ABQ5NY32_9ACTN|nr:Pvc16 family protein [Streptomyces sp. YSPA8]GLF95282.1 DUF4255 domain-containing protein [Streptomyces sp. YSPA8]
MIETITNALQAILKTVRVESEPVKLTLLAPTKDNEQSITGANLYLYEIREAVQSREAGQLSVDKKAGTFRPPYRFFTYSYMLTAHNEKPEDAHSVLDQFLLGFVALDYLDLKIDKSEPPLRVQLELNRPPAEVGSLGNLWTGLGSYLRPFLDIAVTAPVIGAGTETTEKLPREIVLTTEARADVSRGGSDA